MRKTAVILLEVFLNADMGLSFFMLMRIFDLNHNAGGLSRLYVCCCFFFLECTSFYVESVLMKIKDNIAMHLDVENL